MENYKNRLKKNLMYTGIILILCGITVICGSIGFFEKYRPEGNFGDFLSGFQAGIFIAFILIGVYRNVRFLIALNNYETLRQMYIRDTDERNIKISEMTGIKLQKSVCYPLLLASVIAGYLSTEVFFALIAVVLFISIITIARKIYFNKIIQKILKKFIFMSTDNLLDISNNQ